MKPIAFFAAAVLAVCAVTPFAATAATDYSASFSLQGGLPALGAGSSWTSLSDPRATTSARDITGYTPDPNTGQPVPQWGAWRTSQDMHRTPFPPFTMGESLASVPQLNHTASGSAQVAMSSLSAKGKLVTPAGEVHSGATWSRNFSLAANASFTFSGLSTLGIVGTDAPLLSTTSYSQDPGNSFASLTMADAFNRVSTGISASITSLFPSGLGGFFDYDIGPNGLLSLTVTNTSNSVLTGTLSAGSFVNAGAFTGVSALASSVAAPVPEPAALFSMLAGLGLVGAVVRRRTAAAAAAAAA